jgi:RecB family exonuclease
MDRCIFFDPIRVPPPYLLEEKFTLHVGPFLLAGRFDRVDITPEGYEILDYKLSHRQGVGG